MLTHEYTYAYAAVDVVTGAMDSLILPYVNTDCMQVFVDEVAARHPERRIVMVLDGAGWHRGQGLKLPANLRLLSLPPYAPELNPVEHVWDELRDARLAPIVSFKGRGGTPSTTPLASGPEATDGAMEMDGADD